MRYDAFFKSLGFKGVIYSQFMMQSLQSMSCVTFPIAVLMRSHNSGSVFGSGGT